MEKPLSLILTVLLLMTCSGCFWGWDHGHGGHNYRDHGGHGDQDRGGHAEQR